MQMDPEGCELLRAIIQRPDEAANCRIRQLAGGICDWDAVLKVAGQHRVLQLLSSRLAETGTEVPADVQDRLQAAYRQNMFHCLANAAELIALLKAFAREDIPAIPFKGVVLGASVYGDPAKRAAGDLDILIHLRDLPRATAVLKEGGYDLHTPLDLNSTNLEIPEHWEYHFERPSDGMVTELRWRLELAPGKFKRDLGMDWAWPRRQIATLAGAEVPNLDPEITLLMLCMHGSKHRWTRLLWICDVAQLLAARPGLNWDLVVREARQTGLLRSLALGSLLAHRVAGAELPPTVLRKFESNDAIRKLAEHINDNMFEAPGSMPESTVPYNIHLLGFRERMRLILSLDLLRPNERDRALINLPKWLDGLYYLIRPIRILVDRSQR